MIGIYFSGTGNTKFCIETFMDRFGAPAVSMEDPRAADALAEHTELVLAYPIYYSSLPKIVTDFITRAGAAFRGKRVFLIATMGLFSGDGASCAARLLRRYEAEVTGGLHLKMPDCIADVKALKRTPEKNRALVVRAADKATLAARAYQAGRPPQEGLSLAAHGAGLFGQRLWFGRKTRTYSDALKIDAAKCVGCGACAAVCPMQNLEIAEQKAVPGGRCTMCYRCVHTCPRQAVTLLGGKVVCRETIADYR